MPARRIYCTGVVIAMIAVLARIFPHCFFRALGQPAAYLSALWMGVPCADTGSFFLLMDPSLPIAVTPACSGADFLALLCGLMAPVVLRPGRRRFIPAALLCAVAITIAANSCRMITGWYAGVWARQALSRSYWPGIHLATGIVVFLTILITTHILLSLLDRRHYT